MFIVCSTLYVKLDRKDPWCCGMRCMFELSLCTVCSYSLYYCVYSVSVSVSVYICTYLTGTGLNGIGSTS